MDRSIDCYSLSLLFFLLLSSLACLVQAAFFPLAGRSLI